MYHVATYREAELFRELVRGGAITRPWEVLTCRHCGTRNVFQRRPLTK
jgi:hypothetical protein